MRIIAFNFDHDVVDATLKYLAKVETRPPRGPPGTAPLSAAPRVSYLPRPPMRGVPVATSMASEAGVRVLCRHELGQPMIVSNSEPLPTCANLPRGDQSSNNAKLAQDRVLARLATARSDRKLPDHSLSPSDAQI